MAPKGTQIEWTGTICRASVVPCSFLLSQFRGNNTQKVFGMGWTPERRGLSEAGVLIAFAAPSAPRILAGLFAAAVNLLEEIAHYADEGEQETAEQQEQGHGAPEGSVCRKPRLKAGRHQRHASGKQSKKDENGGENVEVARHL